MRTKSQYPNNTGRKPTTEEAEEELKPGRGSTAVMTTTVSATGSRGGPKLRKEDKKLKVAESWME